MKEQELGTENARTSSESTATTNSFRKQGCYYLAGRTNNTFKKRTRGIAWKLFSLAVEAPLSSSSCSGTTISIIAGMLLSPWYLHDGQKKKATERAMTKRGKHSGLKKYLCAAGEKREKEKKKMRQQKQEGLLSVTPRLDCSGGGRSTQLRQLTVWTLPPAPRAIARATGWPLGSAPCSPSRPPARTRTREGTIAAVSHGTQTHRSVKDHLPTPCARHQFRSSFDPVLR